MVFALDNAWKPVNIGAGGWLVGIDIAPDGTMVVRTDTYGAYLWNGSSWTQLLTANSMPSNVFFSTPVYELRIAPSNSNIMYVEMTDGIYKTVDKGATWVKTAFPITNGVTSHDNRMDGQKMAIDPSDPNTVFAGTQKEGLWVTRDGGSTWQKIAAVPMGGNTNDPNLTGIAVKGSEVFVGTAGNGVYMSQDKGYTWKAIGGPADVSHAVLSSDGSYYASDNSAGALWKYSNGSWLKIMDHSVHAIAVDPFNSAHIVVTNHGGDIRESFTGGATWGEWNQNKQIESSNDVAWLEDSGRYLSSGGLVFDPLVPNKLWQSAGVGVWTTSIPKDMNWSTVVPWESRSKGIEQLVANEVLAPAGGNPIFASWDRPFFEMGNLDEFPTSYGGGGFSMGWSIDYASSNPGFVVGISDWWGTEESGFSTDGGKTWQKFEGLPVWAKDTVGGSIAASTPLNFVWVATGNQPPAYTLDGGKTWANISIPGKTDWSEIHHAYYLGKTTITADRVQPNTFYLYDVASGVYRTTDGGVTWTRVFDKPISDWSYWNSKIEAVPGSAGELFFTSGPQHSGQDLPGLIPFMHSKDGGKSWQVVAGVEASTFGFGAPKDPGGPATIFVYGAVNGKFGIWYSADNAQTWVQIGERPMGSLDGIRTISGDMDNYGMVYVGFGGSGFAYYDFHTGGTTTPPPPAPDTKPAAPNQVVVIDAALDDVGAPASVSSGATVNDATPTLTGTLSAALGTGQKVAVFRDGQLLGYAESTTTKWTFADPGAGDGKHDYVVRVVDAIGQQGAASGAFSLSVDTLAPTQAISVTGVTPADNSSTLAALSTMKMSLDASPGSTVITGTIAGSLGADESVIVFRDGVKIGTASVNFGNWSFGDAVNSGSVTYTAQIHDAAGNTGKMSNVLTVSFGSNEIFGTFKDDALVGSSGADRISGVPQDGGKLGKGSIDVLTGAGGDDVFILGDSRGRFYDDYNVRLAGRDDYARITDFDEGDKLQLLGSAKEYLQGYIENLGGFSGTGIYHDSNGNGVIDHRDDLIALVQNHGPIDLSGFIFV